MSLLKQEIYKLLWKQGRGALLLGFLLLKLLVSLGQEPQSVVNLTLENNKADYENYLTILNGEITPEKEAHYNEWIENYENAEEEMYIVVQRYIDHKITTTEYVDITSRLKNEIDKREIIELLKSQYSYVKQDTNQRYFIAQNGWANLFAGLHIDLLLLLFLLVLVTPVFCREYETNMHEINLTCTEGRGKVYATKTGLAIFMSILAALLFFFSEILVNYFQYGLPHADYPIQSIPMFGEHTWNVSLKELLVCEGLLRSLGTIYFVVILLFSSLITKKAISTIFLAVFVFFGPYFLFSEEILCLLPLPTGFFLSGLYQGIYEDTIGQRNFYEAKQIIELCFNTMAVIVMLLTLGVLFYHGKFSIGIKKGKKRLIITIGCLGISLLCSGCQREIRETDEIQFNSYTLSLFHDSNDFFVNTCNVPFLITDKKSGEEKLLFHDAFLDEEGYEKIHIRFLTDSYVYYSKSLNEWDYDIMRLNLKTYEEEVIYSKRLNEVKGTNFMNLHKNKNKTSHEISKALENQLNNFWIYGVNLYVVEGKKMYSIDLNHHYKTLILDDIYDKQLSYSNGFLYYLNNQFYVIRYSFDTGEKILLDNYLVHYFLLKDDLFVFQTLEGSIGLYNLKSGVSKIILKGNAKLLDISIDKIFFTYDDHKIHAMDYQGNHKKVMYKSEKSIIQFKNMEGFNRYYIALANDNLEQQSEWIKIDCDN